MNNVLQLLETKCKKHDRNWFNEPDGSDAYCKGRDNFDEIQRLCSEAKKQGLTAQAHAIVSRYLK